MTRSVVDFFRWFFNRQEIFVRILTRAGGLDTLAKRCGYFRGIFFLVGLFSYGNGRSFRVLLVFDGGIRYLQKVRIVRQTISITSIRIFSHRGALPSVFFNSNSHVFRKVSRNGTNNSNQQRYTSNSVHVITFRFVYQGRVEFQFILRLRRVVRPTSIGVTSLSRCYPTSRFRRLINNNLRQLLSISTSSNRRLYFTRIKNSRHNRERRPNNRNLGNFIFGRLTTTNEGRRQVRCSRAQARFLRNSNCSFCSLRIVSRASFCNLQASINRSNFGLSSSGLEQGEVGTYRTRHILCNSNNGNANYVNSRYKGNFSIDLCTYSSTAIKANGNRST